MDLFHWEQICLNSNFPNSFGGYIEVHLFMLANLFPPNCCNKFVYSFFPQGENFPCCPIFPFFSFFFWLQQLLGLLVYACVRCCNETLVLFWPFKKVTHLEDKLPGRQQEQRRKGCCPPLGSAGWKYVKKSNCPFVRPTFPVKVCCRRQGPNKKEGLNPDCNQSDWLQG